ncbi:MAG: hypothetical protein H6767_03215 [Candidatus Peribacteria bacterium]|nr:MAG: hypothetical protein H6767_03215 [Candidatus Peribacteria bacterium]
MEEKEEVFTGTVIERIDEAEGINGNFRAMIGTYLMKKYVGNIDDIEEVYNHTVLNKPEERTVLYESEDII